MSKKHKITEVVAQWQGQGADAHYVGYFECFNRGLFYEAHDVLEQLWLTDRPGPKGDFYKGLIQLAGAFVHLQKNRLKPATALFNLAANNFKKYPAHFEQLDLRGVLELIGRWLADLEGGGFQINPLTPSRFPQLTRSLDQ